MYDRYLNNDDYLALIRSDFLRQITDDLNEVVFEKREQHAEVNVVEYLKENYCIEEELALGKAIVDYNGLINYPKGVYFSYEGEIVETIRSIRGITPPDNKVYWKSIPEDTLTDSEKDEFVPYTQRYEWSVGDKIIYNEMYWECLIEHGFAFENIHIPGEEVHWKVLPDGTLTDTEVEEILEYDVDKYDYVVGDRVEFEDNYWECLSESVNPQFPEYRNNIKVHDPRNASIVRCMSIIALYNMHKSISPNDIPNIRVLDYEIAMKDLCNYNKLKLTPGIQRRSNLAGDGTSVDWAFGKFESPYVNNDFYV